MAATNQLRGFALPLAFLPNGDLVTRLNGKVSLDTARTAVLTLERALPLSPLGTLVPLQAFDPNDLVTHATIAYQVARGLAAGSKDLQVLRMELVPREDEALQFRVTIQDRRLDPAESKFILQATPDGWVAYHFTE